MGVKVVKRAYKNQFYQPSDTTDWLLGNVGDWQRLEVDVEVTIDFYASQQESVSVDAVNDSFKLNNGKGWQDYGFDIGDSVIFSYVLMTDDDNDGVFVEVPTVLNFNIINIYADTMEVDIDLDFGIYDIFPTDRGNVKIKDVKFETLKDPEGLKFRYSHLTNESYQSDNLSSFIDGSTTEFSFAGLQNLPSNVNQLMNPDGIQSGMAIDQVFIKKLSGSGNTNEEVLGLSQTSSFRLETRLVQFFSTPQIWYNKHARSIPMNRQMNNAQYQNPVQDTVPVQINWSTGNAGNYINGQANTMFLFNAATGGTKFFDASVSFRVTNTNENSNSDKVSLVLLRYSTGSSLNFVQRIEVASWNNANDLVGQTLTFSGIMAATINSGDSLCFAVEYYHLPQSTTRWVDIQMVSTNVQALSSGSSGGGVNKYRITTDFMLASIFEQPSNLEDLVAPSTLFNAGSLTDNFEVIVYPEWNNPNTVIKNNLDHTERLGNTGWFNENFNGLDNNFNVESVLYYDDDGNPLTELDYASPVNVKVIVSGIDNLTTLSEFGIGFAWIPQNEEDYHNKMTPFHKNLFINTGRIYTDGLNDSFNLNENVGTTIFDGSTYNDAKMDLQASNNILVVQGGSDVVEIKARFIPNAQFFQMFENKSENDRKYLMWLSVSDQQQQINFSDRVSLLIDYKDMIKTIPPAGPLPGMTNRFIEHPQDENSVGVEKYFGFIEDDVLARMNFKIDTTDNKFIRSFTFGYEVVNTETGAVYILENYPINVSNIPIGSDGIQNINVDDIRGFKLENGNNKNFVKVLRDLPNDNGNEKAFLCYFATKLRWEDWLNRDGVPLEFYDNTKQNDGYHNDWVDYLRAGNVGEHKFNFFVFTDVDDNGEFKRHKNTFELTFNDYDENLNIQTDHRYFRDSDNTDLTIGIDPESGKPLGVLLDNEPTRIEITYTHLTEDFDITKMYAVTTMEVDKGAGRMEHRQLSSVWGSENDNFLIPLTGETRLKFEQLASNVVKATCLVDPNKLTDALRYKVSGRIGCFPEGIGNPKNNGKYEARYEAKYE